MGMLLRSYVICTFSFHLDSTLWLFTSAGWKHSTGASVNLIMAWIDWGYLWLQHLKLYFNPEFISRYLFIYQSNSRLLKHCIQKFLVRFSHHLKFFHFLVLKFNTQSKLMGVLKLFVKIGKIEIMNVMRAIFGDCELNWLFQ